MLTSVVAALALLAQDPATLTYSTVAKTADVVLAEIAQKAGLQIETTADAKKHVLVVHVTDAPIDAVLDRIATVTSSRWNRIGERRVLQPDTNARKREQSAQTAKRAEDIRQGLEALRKQLAKDPKNSPVVSFMGFGGSTLGSPAARALAKLAFMLDPNEVARLATGSRVVFATSPNRMQRPMRGGQVDAILNALVAEHNEYVDEAIQQRQEMRERFAEMDENMGGYMDLVFGNTEPKKFESAPSKAVLVVSSENSFLFAGSGTQVELKVYDQQGRAIAQAEVPLATSPFQAAMLGAMSEEGEEEEEPDPEPSEEDLTLVELSEQSLLFIQLESMFEASGEGMSAELLALMSSPTQHDPLSFSQSDALISIAKAKRLNVVANLPDGAMTNVFVAREVKEGATVGQALAMFAASDDLAVKQEDGWFVVMPSDPVAARDLRQDRAALEQLAAAKARDGSVGLDALAAFALRSPPPVQNGSAMLYLITFAPNVLQGIMGDTMDWDMLRFYGGLMASVKAALLRGDTVPFRALGPQSRRQLETMAFGAGANILPADGLAERDSQPMFMQMMRRFMPGGDKDFTSEPTEVMPNGLPPDGYVTLQATELPVVAPEHGIGASMFGVGAMGPAEVAMMQFFTDADDDPSFMPEGLDRMRLGQRRKLTFTFMLSPEAGLSKSLLDDKFAKNPRIVSISNLPPSFLALVAAEKEKLKNSPMASLGMMFGGMGGQKVDPPTE